MKQNKTFKSKSFKLQKYMDAVAVFAFPVIMLVWAISSYS